MNNTAKQVVTGVVSNILFLPPLYFMFFHGESETNWFLVFLSCLPFFIVMGIFWIAWGPNGFRKATWQEEGYKSFKDWFRNSESFQAKYVRFVINIFFPAFIAIIVLGTIAIVLMEKST